MAIDSEQMRQVYDEYSDQIYRFLVWHTGDSVLAEDLTSEVFLRAWKNRSKLSADEQKAWLYRVARNLLTDYWRKKKPVTLDEQEEIILEYDLHNEAAQREQIEQLQKSILNMRPEYQTVLVLRLLEGQEYPEIAAVLEKKEATVRVLYCRALSELRDVYNREHESTL